MQRTKLIGMVTLGLCVLYGDIAVQAQDRDAENQREGRRRGGGGFGRGFQGGGFRGGFGARGGGGGLELVGLLRIDEVQEEISMNAEQQEAVQALGRELRDQRPDFFPENFRELSDAEQADFRKKMQEWSAKQTKETKATLASILEPEQYKRLIEIHIQNEGAAALTDVDVAAKLNLSEEQKTKIAATIEENGEKLRDDGREVFRGAREDGFDFAAAQEKMQTLRKESDERVLAVLTAEQKTAFAAMNGEAFEMPERRFGGGRGGFGGFGGGRRGGPGGRGERPDRPRRPE